MEKKSGWLSGVFNLKTLAKFAFSTALFVGGLYLGVLIDAGTLSTFHDSSNLMAQAFRLKAETILHPALEFSGFGSPDGAMYGTMKSWLAPQLAALTPPSPEIAASVFGVDGPSIDDLLVPAT